MKDSKKTQIFCDYRLCDYHDNGLCLNTAVTIDSFLVCKSRESSNLCLRLSRKISSFKSNEQS